MGESGLGSSSLTMLSSALVVSSPSTSARSHRSNMVFSCSISSDFDAPVQRPQRLPSRFVHHASLRTFLPAPIHLFLQAVHAALELRNALAPATDDALAALALLKLCLHNVQKLVPAPEVDLVLRARLALRREPGAEI